jgi:hypothetical protein
MATSKRASYHDSWGVHREIRKIRENNQSSEKKLPDLLELL